MNIEISNCSAVRLRITASRIFPSMFSFRKTHTGVSQPFLGFPKTPTLLPLALNPSRVPSCPSQWDGDTGAHRDTEAAAELTLPLKEPSVKLFLRIKRAFTALVFHMSHSIKDLKFPTPRGNKITVGKKYELLERGIILNT